MRFEIEFHGPFRVATGQAGPGVDTTVHRQELLPASSLKGLMRAAARQLTGTGADDELAIVARVFGTAAHPSPWAWTGAAVAEPHVGRHARIARTEHGTVADHALAVAEQVWSDRRATFDLLRSGYVDGETPRDRQDHELLLRASAHAVHAVGAARRRGLGWVSVRCVEPAFGRDEVREFATRRQAWR